ncbi:Gpi ethanolamine phosphate transferase 1 [Fasciola hepatica]|uniref:GPI ethanolamine phosphate transferase 1 n=1 Tax=Fasciola hepatica TaxID=6192 RepID=A0A4E0R5S6_FASHE|nr:Gpi ethanolamine phosphate transferase 1 [Fasciola hepatica]
MIVKTNRKELPATVPHSKRNLLLQHAAWGLSHTRVPTESRPGHVAMLGGFYEDVASITKGWQANAVEFDSLFNRTLRGWAWGTHEVVQLFGHGRSDFVKIESSPDELGDLTKHNMTELDTWVVERFIESLKDDKSGFFSQNSTGLLEEDQMRRGHLAFLHLDAADHVGHSFKPSSEEYRGMVRHLDTLIARVVEAVNQSQGSNRVAFVFTADHGMTEWGSHGAGSLHETVTPLLVWGAGLAGPEIIPKPVQSNEVDQYGLPVHSYERRRRELKQADLCPLMAGLLGVPIPLNSVGRVPLEFLALNDSDHAHLVRSNCIQILNQLKEKRNEKKKRPWFFREYELLTAADVEKRVTSAEALLTQGRFTDAIVQFEELTDLAISGLNYYHKYDRPFLGFCIGTIFCLWSLVILSSLVGPVPSQIVSSGASKMFTWFSALLGLVLICLVIAFSHSQPVMHSVYQLVPVALFLYLVCSVDRRSRLHILYLRLRSDVCESGSITTILIGFVVLVLLELIIWGFLYRPLLSVACVIVAIWPVFDHSFGVNRTHFRRLWSCACLALAGFPLLPVIGSTFSPLLVCVSGSLLGFMCHLSFGRLAMLSHSRMELNAHRRMSFVDILLSLSLMSAGVSVYIMHSDWDMAFSMHTAIHVFSWSSLIIQPLVVFYCVPPLLGVRILSWLGVVITPLILLSTHYEGIFILVFITVGLLWIQLEAPESDHSMIWRINTLFEYDLAAVSPQAPEDTTVSAQLLTLCNFRQSILFIFLLVFSFFGTGNIASVNSFDPRSTFCFITSLKPAIMGLLLLIKVLCPMICLGIIYAAVQLASGRRKPLTPLYARTQDVVSAQTALSAILSNFVAVHFFAWLRDEGSWLEIGNSISHYVIAMAFGLAAFLFARFGRNMLTCHFHGFSFYVEPVSRKHI